MPGLETEQPAMGSIAVAEGPNTSTKKFGAGFVMPDWHAIVRSSYFIPAVVTVVALFALFSRMIGFIPDLWSSADGYYSHGFLIPFISGYVIYRRWPKIRSTPVKPGWWALLPILLMVPLVRAATKAELSFVLSFCFLAYLLFGIALVGGFRWMLSLALPVLYLAFCLPIWTTAIDVYTNPLQVLSTKMAFTMLKTAGFEPFRPESTTIYLNNFVLDVGVPCSGLKLVLAITAFTIFFILVANLRTWANVVLLALILPLCLFINGLRIALIGIVGNDYGPDAGHAFHDYSGYICLIICFFVLFKIARALGWKD